MLTQYRSRCRGTDRPRPCLSILRARNLRRYYLLPSPTDISPFAYLASRFSLSPSLCVLPLLCVFCVSGPFVIGIFLRIALVDSAFSPAEEGITKQGTRGRHNKSRELRSRSRETGQAALRGSVAYLHSVAALFSFLALLRLVSSRLVIIISSIGRYLHACPCLFFFPGSLSGSLAISVVLPRLSSLLSSHGSLCFAKLFLRGRGYKGRFVLRTLGGRLLVFWRQIVTGILSCEGLIPCLLFCC